MGPCKKKSLINIISDQIHHNWSQILECYQYLHANPEISLKEYNTSKYIKQFLEPYPYFKIEDSFGQGVIVTIEGTNKEKAVALRCDMDALPINELTDVTYRSHFKDVMHACGHDAHMAIMLGVCIVLHHLREHLPHSVRMIFQPSEEKEPGGAKAMIESGCLKNPNVEKCFGLHVDPNVPLGKMLSMPGPFYARCDSFDILIHGKSKHIARPEGALNPIPLMIKILEYIEVIKEEEQIVIGVGHLQGGVARNVIPAIIKIEGTLRTYDDEQRDRIFDKLNYFIKRLGSEENCEIELILLGGYPYLHNNPELFDAVTSIIEEIIGKENVTVGTKPLLISEDFAYYAQAVPSCFYNLGIGVSSEDQAPEDLHSARLIVPLTALFYGVLIQTVLAVTTFDENAHKKIHDLKDLKS